MPVKSVISYQGSRVPGKGTVVNWVSKYFKVILPDPMGKNGETPSFDWSYPSKATDALDRALLYDVLGWSEMLNGGLVPKLAPKFAWEVVAKFDFEEWECTRLNILAWIERNKYPEAR